MKGIEQDKINRVNKFVCQACTGSRIYTAPMYKANITGDALGQEFDSIEVQHQGHPTRCTVRLFGGIPYPDRRYGYTTLQRKGNDLAKGTLDYKGSRWHYDMHKIEHDNQVAYVAEMVKREEL